MILSILAVQNVSEASLVPTMPGNMTDTTLVKGDLATCPDNKPIDCGSFCCPINYR